MKKPIVAAFDFDGTITRCDSLLPFLRFCSHWWQFAGHLVSVSPYLFLCWFRNTYRQCMKERIFKQFFGGLPFEELQRLGAKFALKVLPRYLRPEALHRLRWHQDQQHRCVLISASVDIYLEPWGRAMGFDEIITSRLAKGADGQVVGKLIGKNCRGDEKVRRFLEVVGAREQYELYAYGDSDGDEALLAIADYPFYRRMPNGAG